MTTVNSGPTGFGNTNGYRESIEKIKAEKIMKKKGPLFSIEIALPIFTHCVNDRQKHGIHVRTLCWLFPNSAAHERAY